MKTQELIKKAEYFLRKSGEGPWDYAPGEFVSFIPEQFFIVLGKKDTEGINEIITDGRVTLQNAQFIVFARNYMQEIIDKLKKYEQAVSYFIDQQPGSIDTREEQPDFARYFKALETWVEDGRRYIRKAVGDE